MKIYKLSDRIKLKMNDVIVEFSPLSRAHKSELQAMVYKWESEKNPSFLTEGSFLAVKYGVKGISGVTGSNGEPYALEFEESGVLTDSCVEDLMNCELSDKLILSAMSFVVGIPKKISNPVTGEAVDGIEILNP